MSDKEDARSGEAVERESEQNRKDAEAPGSEPAREAKAEPVAKEEQAKPHAEPEQEAAAPVEAEEPPHGEEKPGAAPEEVKVSPGAWGNAFNGFAKTGPIMLLIFLCLMIWPDFLYVKNALYCPAEYQPVETILNCLAHNSWFAPMASGLPQWPGFYWLAGLLTLIPGFAASGLLLPTLAAICAALALLAVWALAMAARFGARASFAAGLVLLCAPMFAPLPHFVGPAVLACALMILSLAFFAYGWQRRHSFLILPAAFLASGLAGLCGGPLFLILPLLASLIFLIWWGDMHRAQSMDALFGFILLLALLGVWLGFIMLGHSVNDQYLSSLFAGSWRFADIFRPWWWLPFAIAGAGLVPWLLLPICASWFRILGRSIKTLAASRKDNGSALVWISLALACCMSLALPRPQYGAIAIVLLSAPIFGKAFINLSGAGNRFFFFLGGLCLIAAGAIILAASYSFTHHYLFALIPLPLEDKIGQLPLSLSSLPIIGGIVLAGGLFAFFFARKNRFGGGLVYSVLLAIIISQPALLMLTPELGALPQTRLLTLPALEKRLEAAQQPPAKETQAEQPMPSEQAAPVEQPAPAEQPASQPEQAAPAEQTPVEQPAPAAEPAAPAAQETQAEEAAPAQRESAQPAAPTEQPAPAEEAAPAQRDSAPDAQNTQETPPAAPEQESPAQPEVQNPAEQTPDSAAAEQNKAQ